MNTIRLQEISDNVDAAFPKLIAIGKPFLGSMQIADLVTSLMDRTTFEWKLVERFSYFKLSEMTIVTDSNGILISKGLA